MQGRKLCSGIDLPTLNDNFLLKCKHYLNFQPDYDFEDLDHSHAKKIIGSFYAGCTVLSKRILNSDIDTIIGNVIIFSEDRISISSSKFFENVLLIAPTVIIESGFRGNLQVFCRDTIIVEENSTLTYPSVLTVSNHENAFLSIGNGSEVCGLISMVNVGIANGNHGSILLNEGSLFVGQIFSHGSVSLRGKVTGSAYCKSLFYNRTGSSYLNYLVNTQIDRAALPDSYVFFNIFDFDGEEGTYESIERLF